ncbi:uncharacterized protein ARMOST_21912 [Armillaria ostoyae]|uniref:Uncharacterized protein n=1 Tax=Armillaria ostoyae TaxID=47428 RepID=A0A284SBH2_ARMOS|nr:uncharacterized protein ARMOST_21912 [Armillaria ostoyae]
MSSKIEDLQGEMDSSIVSSTLKNGVLVGRDWAMLNKIETSQSQTDGTIVFSTLKNGDAEMTVLVGAAVMREWLFSWGMGVFFYTWGIGSDNGIRGGLNGTIVARTFKNGGPSSMMIVERSLSEGGMRMGQWWWVKGELMASSDEAGYRHP